MKLFEIGDGLKSILVSGKYNSDWENENTVILYTDNNDIEIRISVISVHPKDETDKDFAFHTICKQGKKKNLPVIIESDKSYYQYSENSQSDNGTDILIHFYEIGFKWNYIIISVTALLENKDNLVLKNTLEDIQQFIPSIEEVSIEQTTIFEPKYTDFKEINNRISQILKIEEDEIDTYHENDRTILAIQEILDRNQYNSNQTYELQSLGIALGDYIQYKNQDYRWAIVRDSYGRDKCLQYKNLGITIFPMTMISKRIEDGEEVQINKLVQNLYSMVKNLAQKNEYEQLDHNY